MKLFFILIFFFLESELVGWVPPPNWPGPDVAFYQSFDDSDGLALRKGALHKMSAPLVSGQVRV